MQTEKIGYERKKDPAKVRAALIDATSKLIADRGLARLTVDAVAKAAGVTKGGLFHHFATKQALIDGVLDMMIANADADMDAAMAGDPEPHGRFTRALLNAIFGDRPVDDYASSRTLCLAMLSDPALQQRWASWIAARIERHADTDDNIQCAIARLAADGLWLSSLHDADARPPITDDVRAALIAMTRASP